MAYSNTPRKETPRSSAGASHIPFWLDDPSRPALEPELTENSRTDLLVIGAGFTGLWTALLAKEENPSRDVLILEAGEVATGAARFGARVILDILDGQRTDALRSRWCAPSHFPFHQNLYVPSVFVSRAGLWISPIAIKAARISGCARWIWGLGFDS